MAKTKKEGMSKIKEREFLDLAMKRLESAIKAESHNTVESISDLKFLNGDQWESEEITRRKRRKRPRLTVNMLPDKVDKVVGDMRQNRARVKIRPVDSQAQVGIARIREGIIADIEYRSNAPSIYDYAGGRAVECAHGAWRVLTRYCEDNPFVQEIYLEVIKNSFAVHLDPKAKDHCKADAKWGFILDKVSKEEFEEEYPNATVPGSELQFGEGMGYQNWFDGDQITKAEYFTIENKKQTLCLMNDGIVVDKEEAESIIKQWEEQHPVNNIEVMPPAIGSSLPLPPQQGASSPIPVGGIVPSQPVMNGVGIPPLPVEMGAGAMVPLMMLDSPMGSNPDKPRILKEKETEVPKVKHYVITACDILKGPEDFPGKYIPIVVVIGKERNIEGKDYTRGLIRDAKDPQRLVNYWNTAAAETVALAPKAPWVGTAKQFEGYEEDYANANVENFPFLKYHPDKDAPGPPMRTHAGEPPVALFTQIKIAEQNLQTVVGLGPDMRDVAPDASAKSLIQRQKPAELSTFPFVDNLSQAIAHGGRIINEMIPDVYDTERDVKLKNVDGTETFVPINMKAGEALALVVANPDKYVGLDAAKLRKEILKNGEDSQFNAIGRGKYGVIVDVGPSYATQRQESADSFVMLAQTNPDLWKIAGDLIVTSLDVNGAEEMAERIRKTLPPGIAALRPGEVAPPPAPPSPEVQMITSQLQLDQVKMQTEMIKQQKEALNVRVAMVKLYKETQSTEVEIRKEIIQILKELHAPEHPADQVVFNETGPGGTPIGMPGKLVSMGGGTQ